ncbi:perilipin-2-like isoform X2 [Girardinichthys multiradiatus]|uniref:perilipin-2-like isoform X2 n=1 Tax=Girardinichthys multiradiatus TaxID=208333 RepID=UPI001FADE0D6|nr:perilipin-2-like isoform X2 [Girardinichthys multiradiatus]
MFSSTLCAGMRQLQSQQHQHHRQILVAPSVHRAAAETLFFIYVINLGMQSWMRLSLMRGNPFTEKVAPNAVARLAKLPVVRSACATLSVLYRDAKSSNPRLRSLCEALEGGVTALSTAACTRASPVIVKLEPQISIANDFACKGLDWLETSFPVLLSPPDEVAAAAKNKVNVIWDVVYIAAGGTVDSVQHTVTWMISRLHQADDDVGNQSMVERAITVASVGLDSALALSEALVDQVLPPLEEDKEVHMVESFEAAVRSGSYSGRVMKLTAKVCRRTYHTLGSRIHSVQVCYHGEFIQVRHSGSGPSDKLSDSGVEPPRTASILAASGGFCLFLHQPDVQLELSVIPTGTDLKQKSRQSC